MKLESESAAGSKLFLILGWVFSAIPILMMGVGSLAMALTNTAAVEKTLVEHGYPAHVTNLILTLEVSCALLYAIPQTAVLGAILLSAYLGGATATRVRVGETQWIAPVVLGIIVWLGLLLRDKRLRTLLPFRK